MERRSPKRGFTLVELLVVIAIIGVLVALLLPAIQAARETARRNSCLNNIKQISLALLSHESAKGFFPVASTAPWTTGSTAKIGAINNRLTGAGSVNGDGYSWLVQILPFMEQQAMYSQISTIPVTNAGNAPNKLLAGPVAVTALNPLKVGGTGASIFTLALEPFRCASHPGADDSKGKIGTNTMAMGSYVALASSHYNLDGVGTGTETPADASLNAVSLYDSHPGGNYKQIAGDGIIAFWQFPGRVAVQPAADPMNYTKVRGNTQASVRDGTSGTVWFTESREEEWSSWLSGYASYVVGADPNGPGNKIAKLNANGANAPQVPPNTGPLMLGWATSPTPDASGQTALNVGSGVKRAGGNAATDPSPGPITNPATQAYFYSKPFMHSQTGQAHRVFGPSSAHAGGVVLHGFADGHGKSIPETIDRNTYLRLITRAGQEVVDESSGGGL